MDGSPVSNANVALGAVREVSPGVAPSVGFPIIQTSFRSDVPVTTGPIAPTGNQLLITPAPYRTDAPAPVLTAQAATATRPTELATNTIPARRDAPTTTLVEQTIEQNANPVVAKPADAGAWSTPGVKADLPAETNKDRPTLTGDDKQVIHVLKGNESSNWPDNQTPDVVIKADGVHVRPDLETTGKTLKELYVKVEDGANEDTVKNFLLKDLNKLTGEKATIDGESVPKDVADEYKKHESATPPTPVATPQAGGDGGSAKPPAPPPDVSKEEQKRLDDLEKAEKAKEQADAPGQPTDNYSDVMKRFDAKGGLSDARSAAVGWCPPQLQGEYAAMLAGMHNPPTPEELAKLQEWLKKHKGDIDQHMDKNANAMEAMGDKDGAGALRDLKSNLNNPDWLAKQGQKDSFFGQSADAINGNPVATPDLGLGAQTRAAIGHSHVVDEVASEYHKANPKDDATSIAQMFGKLSTDETQRAAMVADLQKISESNRSPQPSPTTNPQAPDLGVLSNFPRG